MADNVALPEDVLACPESSFALVAWTKLRRDAAYLAARYNAAVYLVGSALRKAKPRDIDVTIVLSEDAFRARFGVGFHDWTMKGPPQTWIDEVGKLGAKISLEQRLPLDLKVYPARHATQYLGEPRVVLAAPTDAIDEAQAVRDADLALADRLAREADDAR